MKKMSMFAASLFALSLSSAYAAGEDFATGNMADAVKAMDNNGDGMVSKSEFMAFEAADYDKKATQFATGNMTDAVKASKKAAYLKDQEARFDKMSKNADGLVSAKDILGYLKGPASK